MTSGLVAVNAGRAADTAEPTVEPSGAGPFAVDAVFAMVEETSDDTTRASNRPVVPMPPKAPRATIADPAPPPGTVARLRATRSSCAIHITRRTGAAEAADRAAVCRGLDQAPPAPAALACGARNGDRNVGSRNVPSNVNGNWRRSWSIGSTLAVAPAPTPSTTAATTTAATSLNLAIIAAPAAPWATDSTCEEIIDPSCSPAMSLAAAWE